METSPLATPGSDAWAEQFTASLRGQRDRVRKFLAAQQARLEQAEILVEQELQRLQEELQGQSEATDRLRSDRDTLADRLAEAESRLAEAQRRSEECPADDDRRVADEDSQRRYELALDDIRQLKNKNAELQQQVAKARSTAAKLAQQARQPGWLDWEAEKQRILAALEADFDEDDEAQRADRLRIEEVLRMTEEVIAAKDREIEDLKQRLDEQSGGEGKNRDAAATEQALNSDAVIQEERERLKQLQEQWQEKLRQAEIELALERAKLARQRAELAEQLRAINCASAEPPKTTTADEPIEPSACGRWLARMGLSAADREPERHL